MISIIESLPSNVTETLAWGEKQLKPVFGDSARTEARHLLCGLLKCSPTHLILQAFEIIDNNVWTIYERAIERRRRREPAAYILGEAHFMGRDFFIDKRVLIPRPETELLVEKAILELNKRKDEPLRILDVGTGSGCVAVSLLLELPRSCLVATDISAEALEVARENAHRYDAAERLRLIKSDLFQNLIPELIGYFDMIISNPPYIAESAMEGLDLDLFFEPFVALQGGKDGISIIRSLVAQAPLFLKPGGQLIMEIGHDQGEAISDLMQKRGYEKIEVLKDYARQDRIAKGRMNGPV
ncbi:MAG: peptide chain release factor N(5)-glutamine methyltransferase [Elusimicrobia bacterium]|nr:peptide chain release factor N(5)-glutamine methyltransferase [Candidatus Obscuribacterium magneticum]